MGNEDNVCALMLNEVAGANVTYVLYDSAGDILTAILGGHLTAASSIPPSARPSWRPAAWTAWHPSAPSLWRTSRALRNSPPALSWDMTSTFRMFRGLAGAPGMSDAALTYWQEVCRQVSEDPAWTEDYLLARA